MGRKTVVPVQGEWIGENRPQGSAKTDGNQREVAIHCADSADFELPAHSLDAVFTDPPYFGNVQYAELMDFCYVWLRRLAPDLPEFSAASTRNPQELTANVTAKRGMDHFAEAAMAYDAARQVCVLFAGTQTWTWNGTAAPAWPSACGSPAAKCCTWR